MYIKKIKWLDEICKEAEVEISDERISVICFSQPCIYSLGQKITKPLECINAKSIMRTDGKEEKVECVEQKYGYIICGRLIDETGVVRVGDILLHLDETYIPKDILIGNYIYFHTDRIDLW